MPPTAAARQTSFGVIDTVLSALDCNMAKGPMSFCLPNLETDGQWPGNTDAMWSEGRVVRLDFSPQQSGNVDTGEEVRWCPLRSTTRSRHFRL
jgi:hypothetical protein